MKQFIKALAALCAGLVHFVAFKFFPPKFPHSVDVRFRGGLLIPFGVWHISRKKALAIMQTYRQMYESVGARVVLKSREDGVWRVVADTHSRAVHNKELP